MCLVESFLLLADGLLETLLEQGQLRDEIGDGVHEGLLGSVVRGGLDAEDDVVIQGMRVLVAGKKHVGVLEKLHSNHVAQSVVLLKMILKRAW